MNVLSDCIITITVLFITKNNFDTHRDAGVQLVFWWTNRDIEKILSQYA